MFVLKVYAYNNDVVLSYVETSLSVCCGVVSFMAIIRNFVIENLNEIMSGIITFFNIKLWKLYTIKLVH